MNTNNTSEPIVRKRINHNSMWISCRFPSGGYFKYTIRRYGNELEMAFSNDEEELQKQMKTFNHWVKCNTSPHTTYGEMFERLETLCEGCNTGQELITKMK